jgi:hypothetical protein
LVNTPLSRFHELGILDTLLRLTREDGAGQGETAAVEQAPDEAAVIAGLDAEELIRYAMGGAPLSPDYPHGDTTS